MDCPRIDERGGKKEGEAKETKSREKERKRKETKFRRGERKTERKTTLEVSSSPERLARSIENEKASLPASGSS